VVVWDSPLLRLTQLKKRFPLIQDIPAEVFFFGDENALWHAGSANRWSIGIEIRNCGEIHKTKTGYYWGRGRYRYRGRPPLITNSRFWEPYTREQMVGTLWISRLLAAVHPMEAHRFLGHTLVSSTRVDPGPHFPIHEMRSAVFDTPDIPLLEVPFLKEFRLVQEGDQPQDDSPVSEHSLHLGLYRHDWDGEFSKEDIALDKKVLADQIKDPGDPKLIPYVKKALRRLGYYPGKTDDDQMTDEFAETVLLFQGRWKKRVLVRGRRRWRQAVPVNGKIDQDLVDLITKFERQQIHLVS
jgi:N-acetyl-anhydromuramyl-L-alanine amidase AmpD